MNRIMQTSDQIKAEIEEKFGFLPPFFVPALQTPQVLNNLWQQTLSAYISNPLPALFKEKLFAYLARFCAIPYCMICHSCTLRPLGMTAQEVLKLLESSSPTEVDIASHLETLIAQPDQITTWIGLNSALEESLIQCSIFIALEPEQAQNCRSELSRLLGTINYQHLIGLIAYIKTCSTWVESHPEIVYEADQRVQEQLSFLLMEEPLLGSFFRNYRQKVKSELRNRELRTVELAERRRAELELRQSEERFRSLAEAIPQQVWIAQPNGQFSYVNQRITEYYNCTPEQIIEWGWQYGIHPEDLPRCLDQWQRSLATGEPYEIELRLHRVTDGTYRWHLERALSLKDQSGRIVSWFGTNTDIDDRKCIEEALRESEERFRQFAENIREVFWMITADHSQFLYVSPAYEEVWGRSPEGLYENSRSLLEAIHPEDEEGVIAMMQRQAETECDQQYRILRPDGTIRWIRDRSFPIQDKAGQVYRVVGIAEDITDRKQVEQEVHFLQTMTHAIFASTDFREALGVALQKVCEATSWDFGEAWIPHPDGSVLECSPAWYARSKHLEGFRQSSEGFTFALGVGLPGRVWLSRRPEWRRNVSADPEEIYVRAQLAIEYGLKAALGIPIIAQESVLAVLVFYMFNSRDEDKRLIELISASTELGLLIQRKQAEEEIYKALEREKELNELKSRFVTMTSHEFLTPLTTILSSAEFLEHYHHKLTEEKQITHMRRIQATAKHMSQMLHAVLMLGRAEVGKLEFNPAPLDLVKFCQELAEEFELSVGAQHVLIFTQSYSEQVCNLEPNSIIAVCLDEKLLRHILTNLLSNAIKYSPRGSTVQLALICQDDQAIFEVQDQGIGIPAASQSYLFESFYRATNVGSIQGTGLGLSIVKQCVDLHQGKITVTSEIGKGSKFTVTLPLKRELYVGEVKNLSNQNVFPT